MAAIRFRAVNDPRKVCRFCLEAATKKVDGNCSQLFKMLTNVELICLPDYPKGICSVCDENLKSSCKFQITLLEMERCWRNMALVDKKFVNFLKELNLSEEHIYDEIMLEIEMDHGAEGDTSIDQSLDTSTSLLLKPKSHPQYIPQTALIRRQLEDRYSQQDELDESVNGYYASVLPCTSTAVNSATASRHISSAGESRPFIFEIDSNQFEFSEDEQYHSIMQDSKYISLLHNEESKSNHFRKANKKVKTKSTQIKCVVVGDGAVGKTNLILSYLKNTFENQHIPTASDIYNFEVQVNQSPVHATLCDTAGQDSFDKLRQLSYSDCDVFLLCFSVVNPESFESVKRKWVITFTKTKASLLLVGTQCDLRTDSQIVARLKKQGLQPVLESDAWDLASSIGAEFIETSSRTNLRVKETFDKAIWNAFEIKNKKGCFWKKLICLT